MTTLPSGYQVTTPKARYLTEEEKQALLAAELRALRLTETCVELNITEPSPMAELTQWIQDNSIPDAHERHCYYMPSENATYQWLDNHWQRYSWVEREWRPVCLHDPSRDPSRGLNIFAGIFAVLAVVGLLATGKPAWLIGFAIAIFLLMVNRHLPRRWRGLAIVGGIVGTSMFIGFLDKRLRG